MPRTKETITEDKRDIIPFIIFRQKCDLDFRERLCWSLLVFRRRIEKGCKEHQIVTQTRLSRKGVHAALARLMDMKLVFMLGSVYYARRPKTEIAHEKKETNQKKWYARFAYWKCLLKNKPVEDVLLALLRSLAKGGNEAR